MTTKKELKLGKFDPLWFKVTTSVKHSFLVPSIGTFTFPKMW